MTDALSRHLQGLGASAVFRARAAARPDALLDVHLGGARAIFAVETKSRAPYPSEVPDLGRAQARLSKHGVPLLVAPHISAGEGNALTARGWSWADGLGNFDLRSGTIRLSQRLPRKTVATTRGHLPLRGGGLAVVRALIARPRYFTDPRLTQVRLSSAAGVTQARVAQVMAQLREEGLIESRDGASHSDRARLLDAFLDEYRGPGGEEAYFYTLDPLNQVATRFGSARATRWPWAVSADVGPDLIAPVRAPTVLIVYRRGLDPVETAGLVEAEGRGDANLIVRAVRDSSVFGPDAFPLVRRIDGTNVRVADPTQMIWDLHRLGGEDRMEAAEKVRQWLLTSR